jgi:carbonic anhydrase
MANNLTALIKNLQNSQLKYANGNNSLLANLAEHGQQPKIMMISCCDSRVDPALILQCDPGDIFMVRSIANIVPAYQPNNICSTSAALEFGIKSLSVPHLIIMGHSQCGGIKALLNKQAVADDYPLVSNWVNNLDLNAIQEKTNHSCDTDTAAKLALQQSHQNCLTFPWIKQAVDNNNLAIHLWFFDIKSGTILTTL